MQPVFSSKLVQVEHGQVLKIYARTKCTANRFEIELSETDGDEPSQEIPFHLSVRFGDDDEIVRNSHTEIDGWGEEERTENLFPGNIANPIEVDEDFQVSIFIDVEQFFVSINEKPFCAFKHRSDVTKIQRMNIVNDIDRVYRFEHESAVPEKWPANADDVFRASIPRCFKPFDILVIKAFTFGRDQGSFVLKILDKDLKRSYFHMKTELRSETTNVNSQCSNHLWKEGYDLNCSSYPFSLDTPFKIAIAIKESEFVLFVNGETLCVLPFDEDSEKIFSTMNGVEIITSNKTKITVKSFEHFSKESENGDFESWAAYITE